MPSIQRIRNAVVASFLLPTVRSDVETAKYSSADVDGNAEDSIAVQVRSRGVPAVVPRPMLRGTGKHRDAMQEVAGWGAMGGAAQVPNQNPQIGSVTFHSNGSRTSSTQLGGTSSSTQPGGTSYSTEIDTTGIDTADYLHFRKGSLVVAVDVPGLTDDPERVRQMAEDPNTPPILCKIMEVRRPNVTHSIIASGAKTTYVIRDGEGKFHRVKRDQIMLPQYFQATYEWQELPLHSIVESGSEIKFDLAGRHRYARKTPPPGYNAFQPDPIAMSNDGIDVAGADNGGQRGDTPHTGLHDTQNGVGAEAINSADDASGFVVNNGLPGVEIRTGKNEM